MHNDRVVRRLDECQICEMKGKSVSVHMGTHVACFSGNTHGTEPITFDKEKYMAREQRKRKARH